MPIKNLTDVTVKSLPTPPKGHVFYIDEDLPGFAVRVTSNGAKSYVLTYGKDRKRITLGSVGIVPLRDARKRARDILADFQLNGSQKPSQTLREARETYLKTGQWKPSTALENRRLLERHLEPIEDTPLSSLTTADIMDIIDGLVDTPSERAHAFTAIKSFTRWSAARGYSVDLLASLRKPKTAPPRSRTLTSGEIATLLKQTPSWGVYGVLLELLLLTGQRVGQFVPFTGTVTNDRILWTATTMKGNRDHQIPLTSHVNTLLSQLKPFNNFSTAHTRFLEATKMAHFTRHDLRRSFASGLQRLGTPREHIETLLAHRPPKLIATYHHYDYFDECRTALENWEKHLYPPTRSG
jgi:integrase